MGLGFVGGESAPRARGRSARYALCRRAWRVRGGGRGARVHAEGVLEYAAAVVRGGGGWMDGVRAAGVEPAALGRSVGAKG